MIDPNVILLYVDSPTASSAFYADLLGKAPLESSPTFAMFALDSGIKLGLWARRSVQPVVMSSGGATELALTVADRGAVNALHDDWAARGLAIAQRPVQMDFGYTFVALDRDGHRLRVLAPGGAGSPV
jgi:catechol 2,3-dioxygenase-like lactoylglutathione lyase family enzyme